MNRSPRLFFNLAFSGAVMLCLGACGVEGLDQPDAGVDAPPTADFTSIYNSASFQSCAGCHAPGADGFTDGTEATQDWSTRETAYQTLQGMASGLIGNFADCNDVPLIDETPEGSLLVATFDETIRAEFMRLDFPNCNVDTISDMTLKIGGPLTDTELTMLKQWITDGAPDN